MPSGISERVKELVFAIDVSGSISAEDLNAFLSDVVGAIGVANPEKVTVLYWDGHICGVEKYDETTIADIPKLTRPSGGGSTQVGVVCEWMAENNAKPDAVVVMTDGYLGGGWGTWNVPVLWTIIDNKGATPDCGKVVHISTAEL